MKYSLVLITCTFALSGCREKPEKADCEKMARRRAKVFFAGQKGKIKREGEKQEFAASLEECMSSWTKDEAKCAAGAKTRNQLIACRN